MKKFILVTGCWFLVAYSFGQTISQKLQKAYQQFESDSQLKHAISSLYVIDAKTGDVVFDKNSQIGLADASTQKIITATTAFELLGKDYRYKTEFGYDSKVYEGVLNGNLYVTGSGDPTFGSWRYTSTNEEKIFTDISNAVLKKGIKKINGDILIKTLMWQSQAIPDGWIWQDIGNYYGTGAIGLNWRENQFDLIMQSGDKIDEPIKITNTIPELLYQTKFISEVKSAAKGTGDNAYIYLPLNSQEKYVIGTIPVGESAFKISGAMTNPDGQFVYSLQKKLAQFVVMRNFDAYGKIPQFDEKSLTNVVQFYTHYSPSLDSIIYWFLKKSINLYGEALIKTFAYEKKGFGSTDSGVVIVKDFWKQRGIDENELNIHDGSGLSPLNRVTTHAQVEILKYAKTKDWFLYFYDALPEFNGMKMKSGTISDVKAFCGYQTAKDGKEYIFSFIVNNYNGRTSELVNKMYRVLDNLK